MCSFAIFLNGSYSKWNSSFPQTNLCHLRYTSVFGISGTEKLLVTKATYFIDLSLMKVRCTWQCIKTEVFNRHLETKVEVEGPLFREEGVARVLPVKMKRTINMYRGRDKLRLR